MPFFPPALYSHSGGLRYHLRAAAYRHLRWRPFRRTVAGWLNAWQPPCPRLVLVGPSAGHTLPLQLFARFELVVALEPDPLARRWLAWRARRLPLRFEALDVLGGTRPLQPLRERFPDAAILFCNLLGQIPAPNGARWQPLLAEALPDRHWASYHDVASTEVRPLRLAAPCSSAVTLEEVLGCFWHGGELPLVDHESFRLDGVGKADYAVWPLGRGRYHLIEWVVHEPAAAG